MSDRTPTRSPSLLLDYGAFLMEHEHAAHEFIAAGIGAQRVEQIRPAIGGQHGLIERRIRDINGQRDLPAGAHGMRSHRRKPGDRATDRAGAPDARWICLRLAGQTVVAGGVFEIFTSFALNHEIVLGEQDGCP